MNICILYFLKCSVGDLSRQVLFFNWLAVDIRQSGNHKYLFGSAGLGVCTQQQNSQFSAKRGLLLSTYIHTAQLTQTDILVFSLANTGGPRLTRKTGPGKTPCYAKSRCARLLLCSKCPTESPKPRETEESVLGEVTTVQYLS